MRSISVLLFAASIAAGQNKTPGYPKKVETESRALKASDCGNTVRWNGPSGTTIWLDGKPDVPCAVRIENLSASKLMIKVRPGTQVHAIPPCTTEWQEHRQGAERNLPCPAAVIWADALRYLVHLLK